MESGRTSSWIVSGRNANNRDAHKILREVYSALQQKGYDPITQLAGFITTGDPTYITSFNQARSLICRLEREDIVEELVRVYLAKVDEEQGR